MTKPGGKKGVRGAAGKGASKAIKKKEEMEYFVLDTNVLLHDAKAIGNYGENTVVITMTVTEELDRFKKGTETININTRKVVRYLDDLRKSNPPGSLNKGVERDHGGFVWIIDESDFVSDPKLNMDIPDNRIIEVAHQLKKEGKKVRFISKDINARLKADKLGILVDDFEGDAVESDDFFAGHKDVMVPGSMVDDFFKYGDITVPDVSLVPNEFVTLIDENNSKHSALARTLDGIVLSKFPTTKKSVFGIVPKNKQQKMCLDLLLDPNISLVTIIGKAGTGKTLLAVAAALELAVREAKYERVLFTRSIIPMGTDLGFMPGNKDEKLSHWMEGLKDSLAVICKQGAVTVREKDKERSLLTPEGLILNRIFVPTSLHDIKGRSISGQILIVDEAQDLTPREAKGIITRAGDGTKVIFIGDNDQIDNPYLDENRNGLVYVMDRMRHLGLSGHITLFGSVRSALSEAGAEYL